MRACTIVVWFAILLPGSPGFAQTDPPTGWKWVTDAPATLVTGADLPDGGWRFTEMSPGWHVTMGPGGILYPTDREVTDRFVVEAQIFIFPEPSDAGYGVFVGGRRLDGPDPTWIAFLARPDGAAGVFRHARGRMEAIVPWAMHEAVLAQKADDSPGNVLRVETGQDNVTFTVNGVAIASIPRAGLDLDGRFGLRVGRGVNLHASRLEAR